MDKNKKRQLLSAMRGALKSGRAQRKEDYADAREKMSEAVSEARFWGHQADIDHLNQTIVQARSRGMLATVRIPGRKSPMELADVKDTERYQKRPTTRAIKKSRQRGGPEPG